MSWRAQALFLVLLALAACSPRGSGGPWTEPFDDPGGWQLSSDAAADVALVDGQLRFHIFEPGQVAWAAAGKAFGDFQLKVEAAQISGPLDNEYGVLVRMDDDASFYVFSVSGDGYVRAARYDEGTWTILGADWTPSEAVQQGKATNVLEVEAQGTQFVFRVNGTQVLQVADDTRSNGDVGLYAGAFSEGDVVIGFDNLAVRSLP